MGCDAEKQPSYRFRCAILLCWREQKAGATLYESSVLKRNHPPTCENVMVNSPEAMNLESRLPNFPAEPDFFAKNYVQIRTH
jgi:hypothetical protein